MSLFRNIIFFACIASLPLFAAEEASLPLFAVECDQKPTPPPPPRTFPCVCECYCGGYTLGISADNIAFLENVYLLTVGYFNDWATFDIGANYEHFDFDSKFGSNSGDFCIVKSHLGLRNRLWQNLFVSYGAVGAVAAVNNNFFLDNPRPYRVGCFTGLDLQIVRHWMLSFKIYPFEFEKIEGEKIYRVFQTGAVNCSYVF